MKYDTHRVLNTRALLMCTAAAMTFVPAIAQAQDASSAVPAAQADQGAANDIVVTGSRISRSDRTTNTPIVSIGQRALEENAQTELEAKLNKLPQFSPGQTAYSAGFSSPGIATLNMRGLGSSRNLILLDGKRLQPSTSAVEIDINTIPSILIGNVEVITGGASAVYGSDAISGVVNFQTKKLTGLTAQVNQTLNGASDGRTTDFSIATGRSFADNRGSIQLAFDLYDRSVVYRRDRSFYTNAFATGAGSASSSVTPLGALIADPSNLPSSAAFGAVFSRYGLPGTYSPSATYGFNPDGTLFKGSGGVVNYKGPDAAAGYGQTANGSLYYSPDAEQILQSPLRRYNGFAKASFDVSDRTTLYAQGMLSSTHTIVNGSGALGISPFNPVISANNPFIPADLASILASRPNPTANFGITKRFSDILGSRMTSNDILLYQISGGAKGKLFSTGLDWDISASHGHTQIDQKVYNGAYNVAALNSLLQSADGGASLCQGGFNIFALSTVSQSCKDYISRTIFNRTSLTQDTVEANLQGKLIRLPEGDARFALGSSYRRNFYESVPDAAIRTNPPLVNALTTTAYTRGSTAVKEVYGELLLPVLGNLPLVKSFEVDLAGRFSNYDVSGSVWTYKADGHWTVGGGVTLRGGYQRAVRAPNVGELFLGQQAGGSGTNLGSVSAGGGDPCDSRSVYRSGANAARVRALCVATGVPSNGVDSYILDYNQIPAVASGNTALKPETADTVTFGGSWHPRTSAPLLSGFQVSIDYYNIKLRDAIGVVGASTILYNCFNANGSNPSYSPDNTYCKLVTRNPDGSIYQVNQAYLNLGGYRTSGVDGQIDWTFNLDHLGVAASGKVHLSSVISYLDSFKIQNLPGAPYLDYAGTSGSSVGSLPRWKSASVAEYSNSRANIGMRWRHVGGMKDQSSISSPANALTGTSSYDIFDLFGSLKVSPKYTISAGIDNVADRAPNILTGVLGVTDTGTYDPIGRRFYVNVKASL